MAGRKEVNRVIRDSRPPQTAWAERSATARYATAAALAGAIALVALVLFGGDDGYSVTARFENAGQLVPGNQVRLGGRPVGSVESIRLSDDGGADVQLSLDRDIAPLRIGTSAVIRATSLSGIANRYVTLELGSPAAGEIPDGGRIDADDTQAPVDLDQLFNALDPETREGLTLFIRGQGEIYRGRGEQAGRSLDYLAPFLSTTAGLTGELARDAQLLDGFLTDGSRALGAVAERRDELAALVESAGTTAGAIGAENVALDDALERLPGTLRTANTTWVNLRAAIDDLDVLVDESKPATRELAPLLRRLRPLLADARPAISDLRLLVRRPGARNDVTELAAAAPRLERLASGAFPRALRALDESRDNVDIARQYTPDVAAFISRIGAAAANYDANGHYIRAQPNFNTFAFDPGANRLEPRPRSARLDGLEEGQQRRCPGGAVRLGFIDPESVVAPGCDPSTTPPGP